MSAYLGILVLVAVAAVVCGLMVTGSWLLGPKKVTPYKQSPYECGVEPSGDAKERFPIKFYLVAIVFILFDIEVVFLWPWMTVFRGATPDFALVSFISFALYMATFVVGYLYVIRVGAINWDETTSLEPAKFGVDETKVVQAVPEEHALVGVGGGTK
jgi:NADH-quinone oxidoreductase subunit A